MSCQFEGEFHQISNVNLQIRAPTIFNESVKQAQRDYYHKYMYAKSIALVEMVSHIKDSIERQI